MRNISILSILTIFFSIQLTAYTPNGAPMDIWESASPYFLPEDHPIKPALDKVFSKPDVTYSFWTLRQYGFDNNQPGRYSKAVVTTHPLLPGYIIKLYVDCQVGIEDWYHWKDRVLGAQYIREAIDTYGFQELFVVPHKWIYPLPAQTGPSKSAQRKYFVLVAEDMKIVSKAKNLKKWKSSSLPKSTLAAVYTMISNVGLSDSVYAFNLPFTKEGKIAMIDTEFYHRSRIHYSRLKKYLSEENAKYWQSLSGR